MKVDHYDRDRWSYAVIRLCVTSPESPSNKPQAHPENSESILVPTETRVSACELPYEEHASAFPTARATSPYHRLGPWVAASARTRSVKHLRRARRQLPCGAQAAAS